MQALIINFSAFQVGWFACVLGGAWGWPWIGVATVVPVVAVHAWQSPRVHPELVLLFVAAVVGTLWDSVLTASGLLVYPSGQLSTVMAPVWITALWVAFATSLNVSMRWLKGRLWLASLLGAVFGPLSFWGGSRMGAVVFPDPVLALAALAMGWACLMPLMIAVAERFDGWPATTAPPAGDSR